MFFIYFVEGGSYSNILKEISIQMISNEACQESLRNTRLGQRFKLHNNFLCAGGEEGRDTCKVFILITIFIINLISYLQG